MAWTTALPGRTSDRSENPVDDRAERVLLDPRAGADATECAADDADDPFH